MVVATGFTPPLLLIIAPLLGYIFSVSRNALQPQSRRCPMCPACLTTAAVVAAGSASGAGVLGLLAVKFRWFRRFRRRIISMDRSQGPSGGPQSGD